MRTSRFLLPAMIACLVLLTGCGDDAPPTTGLPEVAPPLSEVGNAYEFAKGQTVDAPAPEDYEDLHNVIKLSDNIISGSEPHGDEALKRIAAMGVKTILSVDGKVPDAETARKHGMRYVHVPIKYAGITPAEMAKIAKTFRELDGPFFVHCFHGKHRGPAAAAVGRVVLDGAPRETAMGEMVHCGTAAKYDGLYKAIAQAAMPDAKRTASLAFGFDEAHPFEGIRAGMIRLTRSSDYLKMLVKRGWTLDPDHPDIDPVNEADKVQQLFATMNDSAEMAHKPANYRGWMGKSVTESRTLLAALQRVKAGEEGAKAEADSRFKALLNLCSACHTQYRNTE